MSTNPSYLRSAADDRVKNLRDWGIPLGRRFRALKLWCLIRAEGVGGLQARLRRDLDNARWLAGQVRATPDWKVLAPVPLQTVCLRHEPPGVKGEDLDRHTRAWAERVNRSGEAYLTPATLGGRWMVRVSVGAEPTEREHVESLWRLMRHSGKIMADPAIAASTCSHSPYSRATAAMAATGSRAVDVVVPVVATTAQGRRPSATSLRIAPSRASGSRAYSGSWAMSRRLALPKPARSAAFSNELWLWSDV